MVHRPSSPWPRRCHVRYHAPRGHRREGPWRGLPVRRFEPVRVDHAATPERPRSRTVSLCMACGMMLDL